MSQETAIDEPQVETPQASSALPANLPTTVIEPRSGWRIIDWQELYSYRDLFRFLVWREIRVRYAQSAIGIGWAIIQPVFTMLVFTVVFGRLAKVDTGKEGFPYAIFSLSALVPWTYFANALVDGTNSLLTNADMLRKVYFPRMMMPMSCVIAKLVDFTIALILLFGLMAWYRISPTWNVVFLPYLIALMILTAGGVGMWLTALAVQYRDVKHAMTFLVQILMYAAPVVYPASLIPAEYQYIYALNPMVGVIEGFRAALLDLRPMPWDLLAIGTTTAILVAFSGMLYFRRKERLFADVA